MFALFVFVEQSKIEQTRLSEDSLENDVEISSAVSSLEAQSSTASSFSVWSVADTNFDLNGRTVFYDKPTKAAYALLNEEKLYLSQLEVMHGHMCQPLIDHLNAISSDYRFRSLSRQNVKPGRYSM